MRDDAVTRPLQPVYSGPYQVLKRGTKTYKILVGTTEQTVSIDRLKPAYIFSNHAKQPQNDVQPEKDMIYRTRSGRKVRFRNLNQL